MAVHFLKRLFFSLVPPIILAVFVVSCATMPADEGSSDATASDSSGQIYREGKAPSQSIKRRNKKPKTSHKPSATQVKRQQEVRKQWAELKRKPVYKMVLSPEKAPDDSPLEIFSGLEVEFPEAQSHFFSNVPFVLDQEAAGECLYQYNKGNIQTGRFTTILEIDADENGQIIAVLPATTNLPYQEVLECLTDVFYAIKLPRLSDGTVGYARIQSDYFYKSKNKTFGIDVQVNTHPDLLSSFQRQAAHYAEKILNLCRTQLRQNPNVGSRIVWRLTINRRGKVTHAEKLNTSDSVLELTECTRIALERADHPRIDRSETVDFVISLSRTK